MVLRPESKWAGGDCQDGANNGAFVHRACISSAQRLMLAKWKLTVSWLLGWTGWGAACPS